MQQSGTASNTGDYPHPNQPIRETQHHPRLPIPDAPAPKRGRGRPRLNPLPLDLAHPRRASSALIECGLAAQEGRPQPYTDAQLEELGILDLVRNTSAGASERAPESERGRDGAREEGTEENPYVL